MWQELDIQQGDKRSLARAITLVENEYPGFEDYLRSLNGQKDIPVIGITGPPGAGKSTLVDQMIRLLVEKGERVAVLCVDPSSPFHRGAILGDRVRMSDWYDHPSVFIRSLATRGHFGGLSQKMIEITELLRSTPVDRILIETVGVGQSEIEIAGLADTTIVVVVPEAGDEIQAMKSGLMEIADIFVVNKSDRPEADKFVKDLHMMMSNGDHPQIPVIKTIANQNEGTLQLYDAIVEHQRSPALSDKKAWLMTEKVWELIQSYKMRTVNKEKIREAVKDQLASGKANIYAVVDEFKAL
jgi:LAO/AO transport system kinase